MQHCNFVAGMIKYNNKAWLTHCPMHPIELRGLINIHGHIHDEQLGEGYVNVSCEQVDYTPVLIDELINNYYRNK